MHQHYFARSSELRPIYEFFNLIDPRRKPKLTTSFRRHLHQRIAEHKFSAIGKHLSDSHGDKNLLDESQFCVLRKCQGKFDCLINEMLFIKKLAPSLNTQSDLIRAKLFV
jgi:hypothetical protein